MFECMICEILKLDVMEIDWEVLLEWWFGCGFKLVDFFIVDKLCVEVENSFICVWKIEVVLFDDVFEFMFD